MSTSVKHPQLPQHPQPPHSAANENSSQANLPDQADLGRLYKRAHSSISKESTSRSRRDNFSGSTLSFRSKRSHRDYFSGSPYRAINKNQYMTGPPREAISLSQSDSIKESDPVQNPPHAALPDVVIDIGLELPEGAATSRFPREDRPPVVLEIPSNTPEPSERLISALTLMVNGSSLLLHRALRDRGLPHLPLHAVLESIHLPLRDGVSNGLSYKHSDKILKPYPLLVVSNKGDPDYHPNPCK